MENVQMSLVAVLGLLIANAFFVAAEFALVKLRGFQLEEAIQEGRKAAVLSARIHEDMDAYLAACQLGITMASLGLGWVGEPAVAALLEPGLAKIGVSGDALHSISFIVGFLLFSALHIVIGEQVPKTYAIRKPKPVTLAVAYPLRWFYILVFPLIWLLDRANAAVLSLLGVAGESHHEVITEDELSSIVDNSEAQGELETKTADIIRKAFRFDDQVVREVMMPWHDVDTLRSTAEPDDNEKVILKTQHSRFPVVDDSGTVIGVLNAKDLTAALLRDDADVWGHLRKNLRPPVVVPASLLISSLLEQMRSTRVHMAIVINEHGTYVGIVTLEDMLEEIVGEIEDEWDDVSTANIFEATDTGWRVHGQLPLPDLEQAWGHELPDKNDARTVGGYIMMLLERLPKKGDRLSIPGLDFEVSAMAGRRVDLVIVERTED